MDKKLSASVGPALPLDPVGAPFPNPPIICFRLAPPVWQILDLALLWAHHFGMMLLCVISWPWTTAVVTFWSCVFLFHLLTAVSLSVCINSSSYRVICGLWHVQLFLILNKILFTVYSVCQFLRCEEIVQICQVTLSIWFLIIVLISIITPVSRCHLQALKLI